MTPTLAMVEPPNMITRNLAAEKSRRAQSLSSSFELKPKRGCQRRCDASSCTQSPPCRGRYSGRPESFSSGVLSLSRTTAIKESCAADESEKSSLAPISTTAVVAMTINTIAANGTRFRWSDRKLQKNHKLDAADLGPSLTAHVRFRG